MRILFYEETNLITAETIADLPHTDDGRMRDRLPVVIHIGHFDHVGVVEKHA